MTTEHAGQSTEFSPPDDVYIRQRWIPPSKREWAQRADRILTSTGAVHGTQVYVHRYQARWRAQRLIRLMLALGMHERWELAEHTHRQAGGWGWSIEYRGGINGSQSAAATA